jgi:hypothetical protein
VDPEPSYVTRRRRHDSHAGKTICARGRDDKQDASRLHAPIVEANLQVKRTATECHQGHRRAERTGGEPSTSTAARARSATPPRLRPVRTQLDDLWHEMAQPRPRSDVAPFLDQPDRSRRPPPVLQLSQRATDSAGEPRGGHQRLATLRSLPAASSCRWLAPGCPSQCHDADRTRSNVNTAAFGRVGAAHRVATVELLSPAP